MAKAARRARSGTIRGAASSATAAPKQVARHRAGVEKGGAGSAAAGGGAFRCAGTAVTLPAGVSSSMTQREFKALGRVLARPQKKQRPERVKPFKRRLPVVVPTHAVPRRPARSGVMTRHQLYAYFERIGKLDLFFYMYGREARL